MNTPSLEDEVGDGDSSTDDQIMDAISDAFSSNDKVIEIRPAERSKGIGLKRLLLFGAGAVALAYLVQSSQKPNDLIEGVKGEAADRIHRAAESIGAGTETASERIEEGSERAGEAVDGAVEKASEQTEELGGKATEKTEEAGEKASERAEGAGEEVVAEMVKADGKKPEQSDGDDEED